MGWLMVGMSEFRVWSLEFGFNIWEVFMGGVTQEIRMIALDCLRGHPMNANRMSAGMRRKLRSCLERGGGRYEPLVVRKMPGEEGAYQLINGHHRAEVLREMGAGEAACVVWELTDAETLWMLATVNRVCGEDVPGKRLELLKAVAEGMGGGGLGLGGLAEILPEDEEALGRMLRGVGEVVPGLGGKVEDMPEALTVFMTAGEKREVVGRLRETDGDLRVALLAWARERGA